MQRIEDHLRTLPLAEPHAFLGQNPSYVFFRQLAGEATAKPESASSDAGASPVARLVIDQDTGGAIKGTGRVDLFWGKGQAAGRIAGTINQSAKLFYLVPRELPSIDPADGGS